MRPLALHGHERPITRIKYNQDGDLLFTSAKDTSPNVWFSVNGERLGSFEGHQGAVWSIDCSYDTVRTATAGGDNTMRLWDTETGKQLGMIETKSPVRMVGFAYSGKWLLYTTDMAMKQMPELRVIDLSTGEHMNGTSEITSIVIPTNDGAMSKPTSSLWGPFDESIITGHEGGQIMKWELRSKARVMEVQNHKSEIRDLQYNVDQTMFISASKDFTAKLFDTNSFECLKTYKTDRPINSAAISPIRDHVVLGGGQEARDVTTTSSRAGKFEARFFHLVFEEEFGRVKGHFGPINSVAFHPNGKSYSSGGEDGYVRIHTFDSPYFDFVQN